MKTDSTKSTQKRAPFEYLIYEQTHEIWEYWYVAYKLGISKSTLRQMVAEQHFTKVKVGGSTRITPESYYKYIASIKNGDDNCIRTVADAKETKAWLHYLQDQTPSTSGRNSEALADELKNLLEFQKIKPSDKKLN